MQLRIRAAQPTDVERLRQIAGRGEGPLGLRLRLGAPWRDAYDFGALLERHVVFFAQAADAVVAWASLTPPTDGIAVLDAMG